MDDLTPEHQQRWASFQVHEEGNIPHPVWYAAQMGQWPDGIGPFARLAQELKAISDLFENVWATRLFRSHDLPDNFGWILRADQREWDPFIHSFDKLLSDNIDGTALDKAEVPRVNEKWERLGTLSRLEMFMTMNRVRAGAAK